MTKNRSIPFGYTMENGVILANEIEADAVQFIFNEYANGLSLSKLADLMEKQNIPYHHSSLQWNRNMIKRILENDKYCGTDEYPFIVSSELFESANSKKQAKVSMVNPISEMLSEIRKRMLCLECGEQFRRRGGNTRPERWDCKNPECKLNYRLTDEVLMGEIVSILNKVIENISLLERSTSDKSYQPNLEITRQNNEINRLMDSQEVDFDKAKEEILKLASMKYDRCFYDEKISNTNKVKDILTKHNQLNEFNIGLFKAVVSQIRVGHNHVILVEFINGKVIGNQI